VLLNHLLDRQVLFFGGKGGVGKTTCSAAFALAASRRNKRVLLVSTDPAHSTSDIVGRQLDETPRDVVPGLSALEIDAARESARYVAGVKREIERTFAPAIVRQAARQIDMAAASPGLNEVALLDRMIDLILDRRQTYDLIVFDTAPTGHTLQLLRMPDAMTAWIQALVRHRRAMLEIDRGDAAGDRGAAADADPILGALERRHDRLARLVDCVTDRDLTTFVLVTIPERLPIEETWRAVRMLREARIEVGALIVNRVLPQGLEGAFYAARKTQEAIYLDEIGRRFGKLTRVDVALLPRDVYGLDALGRIGEQLVA
jgi:arsenite-transporting ATPase